MIVGMFSFQQGAFGQQSDTLTREEKIATLQAINRDVWQPFSEAFASGDVEKYINLHAADFLRVGGRGILTKDQYAAQQRSSFKRMKERSVAVAIDFRLVERIVSRHHASERGIFRTISNKGKADEHSYYGKFHVLFRKENGTWKILMDYDSDESGTINAKSFDAAHALEDFPKY